jgi:thiol:disulfide interchange protein DsbA
MSNKKKTLIAGLIVGAVTCAGVFVSNYHSEGESVKKTTSVEQSPQSAEKVKAVEKVQYKEGDHFVSIDPIFGLPQNSVVEIFWYGCPHCYKMEDVVNSDEFKAKSKDWAFQKFHIAKKSGTAGFDFRVYSALVQMGMEDVVGKKYMHAIHENGLDRSNLGKFAEENGLSLETLTALSENEEAKNYFNFISQFSDRDEFEGVPSFVVQGKYIINNKYDIADVANFLLEKESKEKSQEQQQP